MGAAQGARLGDDQVGFAAFCFLIPLGLVALILRRQRWATYEFEFVRETFRVSAYLRDLAWFAWVEFVLVIGLWLFMKQA